MAGGDESNDVLMALFTKEGPIKADCRTQFAADLGEGALSDKDRLLEDLQPGCYFEIEDLQLQIAAPAPDGQAGAQGAGTQTTGVHMDEITVTRQIDRASTLLLQNCIDAVGFGKAVIIKRRATGGAIASGQAYLRYEFDGVLITKIDWTDQHIVKETLTFITRGVQVIYREQDVSGQLGARVNQAEFKQPLPSQPGKT